MATIKKNPDGDLSLGNLRGELVTLQPDISDYASGGYLIEGIGGNPLTGGDVGLTKVLFVVPVGGTVGPEPSSAYFPQWNTATQKLQIFQDSGANAPLGEIGPGTNLASYSFDLLVAGL
jgi:hypothetical protein